MSTAVDTHLRAPNPTTDASGRPTRKRGGRIGRIAGIDIYVHWSFALLLVWIFVSHVMAGRGARAATAGTAFIATVFVCVVLHELGHAAVARHFGIRTRDITLYPIGGVSRLDRIPDRPSAELWVALAGPTVNLLIAGLLGILFGFAPASASSLKEALAHESFVSKLLFVNVSLAVFNLIPAFPMDGGRVLRAILAMRLDYLRATQYAAMAGQVLAVMFGLLGLFFNPFLLFIAFFVFVAAQQESHSVLVRSLLAGVPVRQAMVTRFSVLPASASLGQAAEEVVANRQKDFPVVEDGRLLGVLTQDELLKGLAEGRHDAPVSEVVIRQFGTVDPGDKLDSVLSKMQGAQCGTLLVLQGNQLVGVLTAEDVGEWIMLHAAGSRRPGDPLGMSRGLFLGGNSRRTPGRTRSSVQ